MNKARTLAAFAALGLLATPAVVLANPEPHPTDHPSPHPTEHPSDHPAPHAAR